MGLAPTQRRASAVSLSLVVNGLLPAPQHPNVNYRAQKKKRGSLPFTTGQVYSVKTNGCGSLGFQSQE